MKTEQEIRDLSEELRPIANDSTPSQTRAIARNIAHTLGWILHDDVSNPREILGEWIDMTPEKMDDLAILVAAEMKRKAN